MEGDPCAKGCEFESQQCILDGHFLTLICWKKGRGWHFFERRKQSFSAQTFRMKPKRIFLTPAGWKPTTLEFQSWSK